MGSLEHGEDRGPLLVVHRHLDLAVLETPHPSLVAFKDTLSDSAEPSGAEPWRAR